MNSTLADNRCDIRGGLDFVKVRHTNNCRSCNQLVLLPNANACQHDPTHSRDGLWKMRGRGVASAGWFQISAELAGTCFAAPSGYFTTLEYVVLKWEQMFLACRWSDTIQNIKPDEWKRDTTHYSDHSRSNLAAVHGCTYNRNWACFTLVCRQLCWQLRMQRFQKGHQKEKQTRHFKEENQSQVHLLSALFLAGKQKGIHLLGPWILSIAMSSVWSIIWQLNFLSCMMSMMWENPYCAEPPPRAM